MATWPARGQFFCSHIAFCHRGDAITVVDANEEQLIAVIGGTQLVLFDISGGKIEEVSSGSCENEVACISIAPLGDDARSKYVTVGLWKSISASVLRVPDLSEVASVALGGDILPRSILLFSPGDGDASSLIVGWVRWVKGWRWGMR